MKVRSLHFGKAMSAALFVLLLSVAGMTKGYAYDFSAVCSTGQTLYYTITSATNREVALTCPGTVGTSCWSGFTKPTGNIILPENVQYNNKNYNVTKIDHYAFYGCSGLTGSLIIPNSVTFIGWYAFYGCSGFTGSLTIPNSVTTIGGYAFYGCSGFTGSLTIGNSVTTIGEGAFYGCSGFTGSLTIGNSVIEIGVSAFRNCSGFTGDLTIPNSVTRIGAVAFGYCSGFTGNLTISNSVAEIGHSAFCNCSGFTGNLILSSSLSEIKQDSFKRCSGFTGGLNIPSSVTAIRGDAFYGCSGFTGSLNIPNSVTIIGSGAFGNCSGFTGVWTIPSSVTQIAYGTFSGCSGFTGELTIPNTITEIDDYAFSGCSGFTGLAIPNTITEIGDYAFSGCSGFTGDLTIPNTITEISNYAFSGCSGFTGDLSIPQTVSSIGERAFYNCSGFTGSLTIPNSVTSIGSYAFYNCSGFSTVFYNVINYVGYLDSPFRGCGGSLVIGDNVEKIPAYMFQSGGFTGSLTIPNSVTEIGYDAFGYCSGFTEVIFNAVNCADSYSYSSSFAGCGGVLTIGEGVERIPAYMFQSGGFTGSLTIPNSVTTIGTSAFSNCSGFTGDLTIGNSVTTIGDWAFSGCSGIVELHYNATNCQNTGFGFGNVWYLKKIVIGEDVEFLPDNLFAYCSNVQFIRSLAETPPIIGGAGTFLDIDKGVSVAVPCGTIEDYEEAPYWSEFTNYTDSEYQITVMANPDYLGSAAVVQQPTCNSSICVIRATPARGCRFINWTCDGEEVTQIRSYSFHVDEDKVMVANFAPYKVFTGGGGGVWSDPANWEPEGVPTDTMGVDIQANVIVDTDVNVGSVFIRDFNSVLTVMPDAVLTVNQTLDSPYAFGVIVEDGGQIVHHNEGVWAIVKKTVEPYNASDDNWSLISFPLADSGYVASVENMLSNNYDLYYYDEPTHYWMNQENAANGFDQLEAGKGYLYANSGIVPGPEFDQAQYVTNPGTINGYDASVLQGSQSAYGTNVNHESGYRLGDDFTLSRNATIQSIEVFGYQTGSTTTSTFTGMYVQIYDGNPMEGGQPIWGNMDDNIITATSWTGCYRCGSNLGTTRPIMSIKAENLNIPLVAGTYYLTWNLSGSESSGPWGIPVTIQGLVGTGNGLQYSGDTWNYYYDSGSGTGLGFAFKLTWLIEDGPIDDIALSFSGQLENGSATVTVPLSYTETAGNLKGFNLVGNPFVHNVTSYGSTNVAEGCFRLNEAKDNLIVSEINETHPLKPAEGFFVKATDENASITFNPGRGITVNSTGSLWLEVAENGRVLDRLIVKKESDPLEKLSLNEDRTKLFVEQDHQEMAIVPLAENEQPINFKAAKNGTYTLTVNTENMDLDYLHLIDNLTGNDVDMLVEPSYSFEARTSDYDSRFRLVFKGGSSTGSETAEPFAYFADGEIHMVETCHGASLQIVDVMGRVCRDAMIASPNQRVSTNGMIPGVYVLRLVNGDDVKTQKIVID